MIERTERPECLKFKHLKSKLNFIPFSKRNVQILDIYCISHTDTYMYSVERRCLKDFRFSVTLNKSLRLDFGGIWNSDVQNLVIHCMYLYLTPASVKNRIDTINIRKLDVQ